MSDEAVQKTNDDATQCKLSAVSLKYWNDPYLGSFKVRANNPIGEHRKAPEIHRGYFTRVSGIWSLLEKSIEQICKTSATKFQIVNLGAGFDTLFWRFTDHLRVRGLEEKLNSFVDIDLAEVTAKKCMYVRKSKLLLNKIAGDGNEEVKFSRTDLHGEHYHIIAANFTDLQSLESKIKECAGFSFDLPTIFVAECVFVYIDPAKTKQFLQWSASKFHSSIALINHEQLNIFDKFGQVMLENLSQRGCSLPGLEACRDKTSHLNRLIESGWQNGHCWTMNEIYNYLPKDDVERVEKLDFLDERELVNQLFEHYCVSFGWKGQDFHRFDQIEFW